MTNSRQHVVQMIIYIPDRVENTVRKGENAGLQHFLLYPKCVHNVF